MNKLIILSSCISFLLFSGCNTYKKQLNKFQAFALQHQAELAKLCATVYPVKDSVGKTEVQYKPANNVNITGKLDSVKHVADSLQRELAGAAADTSNPCRPVILKYQNQLIGLNAKIKTLHDAYRPCKPDTIKFTIPTFIRDRAAEAVLENQLSAKQDSLTTVKANLKNTEEQSKTRLYIVITLAVLIIIAGVLKLMGKF